MRSIAFLFFALMIVCILFLFGCHTENPICSDNYCVSGEIFLRSQLRENDEFSEIDIVESDLIASFAGATPRPAETAINTDADIIETDVLTVSNSLKNNDFSIQSTFISVNAIVDEYLPEQDALYLKTQEGSPTWIIRMFAEPSNFDISQIYPNAGTPYKFVLWVSGFERDTVFCRAVNPRNITSGRSVLDKFGSVINTTVSEVVDSINKGESFFIFKYIVFTAPIIDVSESTNQTTGDTYQVIDLIKWESDILDEKETHSFRVHPTSKLYSGTFDQPLTVGESYNFNVIVHYLSGRDFFDEKDVGVHAYLAD